MGAEQFRLPMMKGKPLIMRHETLMCWLYVSTAKAPPRSQDDALIYLQAKNRNHRDALTGYLHREGKYYVQYVEGPPESVNQLRARIDEDPRHHDLRVLHEGPVARRRFADWDMALTRAPDCTFRDFQARRGGGETDISKASARDILAFMEEAVQTGQARCVSQMAG